MNKSLYWLNNVLNTYLNIYNWIFKYLSHIYEIYSIHDHYCMMITVWWLYYYLSDWTTTSSPQLSILELHFIWDFNFSDFVYYNPVKFLRFWEKDSATGLISLDCNFPSKLVLCLIPRIFGYIFSTELGIIFLRLVWDRYSVYVQFSSITVPVNSVIP